MKIFYITGKSGCGKDTIKRAILKRTDVSVLPLCEATTRPMRDGESEGVEHQFISNEEMDRMAENGDFIEMRSYEVNQNGNQEIWRYATLYPEIDAEELIFVGTGTLESLESLYEIYGKDVVKPILLDVTDFDLLNRSIRREKGGTTKVFCEICRRFISDADDYSEKKIKALGITRHQRFKNTESITDTVSRVMAYVLKNSREERALQKESK